jgi:hypothetical protein
LKAVALPRRFRSGTGGIHRLAPVEWIWSRGFDESDEGWLSRVAGLDQVRGCPVNGIGPRLATVALKNLFCFLSLQTIIGCVESKWSPDPSPDSDPLFCTWTPDAADIAYAGPSRWEDGSRGGMASSEHVLGSCHAPSTGFFQALYRTNDFAARGAGAGQSRVVRRPLSSLAQPLRREISAMANESRRTHTPASHRGVAQPHHLLRGTAVDNPPDAPVASLHRAISANTPQPRYSRVYAA